MRPVTITRFVCLFTLLSLVPLGLAIANDQPRAGEIYRVLNPQVGGVPQPAPGLTYDGAAGQTLILGQVLLILVCTAAATLGHGLAQRAGVLVLTLWAGLWTFDAGQAAVATGFFGFWGAFALTGVWLTLSLLWLAQLCLSHRRVAHANDASPAPA